MREREDKEKDKKRETGKLKNKIKKEEKGKIIRKTRKKKNREKEENGK